MKSNEHKVLIGLSKMEILEILGDELNFYPDKEWMYVLKKYWWGKSRKLYILFDDEDKVTRQHITFL